MNLSKRTESFCRSRKSGCKKVARNCVEILDGRRGRKRLTCPSIVAKICCVQMACVLISVGKKLSRASKRFNFNHSPVMKFLLPARESYLTHALKRRRAESTRIASAFFKLLILLRQSVCQFNRDEKSWFFEVFCVKLSLS
jgi:hypothetical protein